MRPNRPSLGSTGMTRTSASGAPGEPVAVTTTYTLCANDGALRAVSAVGRIEGGSHEVVEYGAYFTDTLGPEASLDESELVFLGSGPPTPSMVLVPLLNRLLIALGEGRVDQGWSGYVVGSGVVSRVLHALAPVIGARQLVDVDATALPQLADRAGKSLFLVTDPNERRLVDLLASIPDRSLVALLVPSAGSSAISVNFYDTIHKKSLTLIGQSRDPGTAHQRALDLARTRLDALDIDLPIQDAAAGRKIDPGDRAALILDWS